jgi:CelD/BcsL family acetyltransferase involved in cellulose biosynthesis
MVERDYAFDEVSAELRNEVMAKMRSWFATPDFSEMYSPEPAEWLRIARDPDGDLEWAFCYRQAERGKSVVWGPVELPSSTLLALPYSLRCNEIHVLRMTDVSGIVGVKPRWRVRIRPTSNDYLLPLPSTSGEYLSSLGSQTRKHLPYYLRRAQGEWGSRLRIRLSKQHEIGLQDFEALVELNRRRMEEKGGSSLWTAELVRRRWQLSRRSGVFLGLYDGDRLAGGTVSYVHQAHAYLALIAHDPKDDRLNLGNLALWLTINEMIGMQLSTYHLLWGGSAYKAQFGAQYVPLHEMSLFAGVGSALRCHVTTRLKASMIFAEDSLHSSLRRVSRLGNRIRRLSRS